MSIKVSSFFVFLLQIPETRAVAMYFSVWKIKPHPSWQLKKMQGCFLLCSWSVQWCVCVHLCDYFISFHKQPQYESTPLQPHISERSASHLEELERKIAAAENKELQLSEIVKQLSNKSSEEKKKMEEKVSVFPDPRFLLSLLQ